MENVIYLCEKLAFVATDLAFGSVDLLIVSPWVFLLSLNAAQLCLLFLPALILDVPRYIMASAVFVLKDRFFTKAHSQANSNERFQGGNAPLVSVVIAGYNERTTIGHTVKSFCKANYQNLEIIVVSDGSSDGMELICRKLEKAKSIRFFENRERSGKSPSVNLGVMAAQSDYVIVADADTTFEADSIQQGFQPLFDDPRVGAVSGMVRVRNWKTNLLTRLQAIEYLFSINLGRRISSSLGILDLVSGAFGVFKKKALNEIGGWDPGPGEDSDITIRLRKQGYAIRFNPNAICFTNAPTTWTAFWKQRLRWNRSIIRFRWRKHQDLYYGWGYYDLKTVLASIDGTFFQVFLAFFRVPFFCAIFWAIWGTDWAPAVGAMYYFYIFGYITLFGLVLLVSGKYQSDDIRLLPTLLLYPFYKVFEMGNRILACLDEFIFQTSYTDTFVPSKVSTQVKRY